MAKRQRTANTNFSSKRPIDKSIIVMSRSEDGTGTNTLLFSADFPCTITGLRWDVGIYNTKTTQNQFYWAIVLVKSGTSLQIINVSDTNKLYEPETNVLAFGVSSLAPQLAADTGPGPVSMQLTGSTKTMRKMQPGDKLYHVSDSTGANIGVRGAIQFFCKS